MVSKLLWAMFLFVPISIGLGLSGGSPPLVFFTACLAVIPLAGLMGRGTEQLTRHVGPGLGGLISSSFGNAAELILAFIALREGHIDVVKASLTGSIIGNMLLVLGLAMLLGGWKHKELRFSRAAAESNSSMMFLAVVALVMPAIYARVSQHQHPEHIESLSLAISGILIFTYAASLVFSLRSHRHLFRPEVEPGETPHEHNAERSLERPSRRFWPPPRWSRWSRNSRRRGREALQRRPRRCLHGRRRAALVGKPPRIDGRR